MSKIIVKSTKDIRRLATAKMKDLKKKIIVSAAKDAEQTIKTKSEGRLVPLVRFKPSGVTVGIPKTKQDPSGSKAQQVEQQTSAVKFAFERLSKKSTIIDLVDRKK